MFTGAMPMEMTFEGSGAAPPLPSSSQSVSIMKGGCMAGRPHTVSCNALPCSYCRMICGMYCDSVLEKKVSVTPLFMEESRCSYLYIVCAGTATDNAHSTAARAVFMIFLMPFQRIWRSGNFHASVPHG